MKILQPVDAMCESVCRIWPDTHTHTHTHTHMGRECIPGVFREQGSVESLYTQSGTRKHTHTQLRREAGSDWFISTADSG